MITKEVNRIPNGTEIVFINPSDTNRRKHEDTILDVEPMRTLKGTIVDNAKRWQNTQLGWGHYWLEDERYITESDERTAGYLVSRVNASGQTVFGVIQARNIVCTASEYDAVWIPELTRRQEAKRIAELEREKVRAEQARRDEIERQVAIQLEEERINTAETVRKTLAKLLGASASMNASVRCSTTGEWVEDGSDYHAKVTGTVTLPLNEAQRLLEYAIEGKFGN